MMNSKALAERAINDHDVKSVFVPSCKVSFWGVRCYLNEITGELQGINWFNEKLISVAVFFHNLMSGITNFFIPEWEQPGFRFRILKRYAIGPTKQKNPDST